MKPAENAQNPQTCGENGGRTARGRPCHRVAGWGRDTEEGRCADHEASEGRVVGHLAGDAPPEPPSHLSDAASERWRALNREWAFTPTEAILLEEALAAWDRVRACRATLAREGYVVTNPDSGNPKRNPAATELDQSLSQVRHLFRQLNLSPPETE